MLFRLDLIHINPEKVLQIAYKETRQILFFGRKYPKKN